MIKKILFSMVSVGVWILAAAFGSGCLTTDEPEYQSTFELNPGELSLSEFDLSMDGVERSTDIADPGGSYDPYQDYCEDYCECWIEMINDDYGYTMEMGDCLDELDDYGYENEDCYGIWRSSCNESSSSNE